MINILIYELAHSNKRIFMKRVVSCPLPVGGKVAKMDFLGPKLADEIYQLCYSSHIFHGIADLQTHLVSKGFEINNSPEKWELCDAINLLQRQQKLEYKLTVD